VCDDDDDDDKLNAQSRRADRRREREGGREGDSFLYAGQGKGALQREGKDSCASYTPRDAHTHAPTHASANIYTRRAQRLARTHWHTP